MIERLKNIDVHFISLVDKGANRKKLIWKTENPTKEPTFTRLAEIRKLDEDEQMAYCIVYAPDEVDSDGHTASAEEVKKAMLHFMHKSRTHRVDKQHTHEAGPYFVAESWLVKEIDPFFKETGAWAAGIKIDDSETWQQVKRGELSGFSIAGIAEVERLEKSKQRATFQEQQSTTEQFNEEDRGLWERVKKFFAPPVLKFSQLILEKDFHANLQRRDLWQVMDAFTAAVHENFDNDTVTDKRSTLLKSISQLQAWVEGNLEKIRFKENKKMNLEEMQKVIAELLAKELQPLSLRLEKLENQQAEKLNGLEKAHQQLSKRLEAVEESSNGRQSLDGQDGAFKPLSKEDEESRIFMPELDE